MNVRMGLIRKKRDWTFEDFNAYWKGPHAALAAKAPNLRAYWQNPVVDRVQRGIDFLRGPWDFDGFSQLWFDDAKESERAFSEGTLAADLIADENHFLGGLHIVTAEQSVVIPVPGDDERARLLKRISVIRRLPSLSEEDFRREWRIHGDLVREMPGVSGYRQNVVAVREREKGTPCDYDSLPIDGIVELWFKDAQTLQDAFASPTGRTTMAHARTFLGDITAFLVDERRVV
ncbi:ethyl tert-butyl ether degradation protein EthD [Variovorax paradoxus]|uniref:Ethyl tert-butyl ether degradation protein EthD n=1 Tax=Variovorax paradoxus TaxID=34073 RepID=A0A0D0MS62_VARPD|nr:EthD family reductase [Variovorax paradoxus]KIQ35346.1 ethyl tert-butyl ether degradation protein EthD [Variovorax paradoxus]